MGSQCFVIPFSAERFFNRSLIPCRSPCFQEISRAYTTVSYWKDTLFLTTIVFLHYIIIILLYMKPFMQLLSVHEFKEKIFNYDLHSEWKFEGEIPAIVDFYADWCGPCRMQAPVLEEISKEYSGKIHVYKIDTQATPELASLFRIRGIPALLFIPMKDKPSLTSGFMPKEELESAISQILKVERSR
jgi:thioredoxin 1